MALPLRGPAEKREGDGAAEPGPADEGELVQVDGHGEHHLGGPEGPLVPDQEIPREAGDHGQHEGAEQDHPAELVGPLVLPQEVHAVDPEGDGDDEHVRAVLVHAPDEPTEGDLVLDPEDGGVRAVGGGLVPDHEEDAAGDDHDPGEVHDLAEEVEGVVVALHVGLVEEVQLLLPFAEPLPQALPHG
jgi:hypothetical protein